MKVVFHEKYLDVYSCDPASEKGRLDGACETLKERFTFMKPEPARESDLLLVHDQSHIEKIGRDGHLYEVASLAVGGAIHASEIALDGEPAFGLIRPPGHHASPNSCWGFCYFNNIAIAVRKLVDSRRIKKALIIDFDLHFGDGTHNTFAGDPNVKYHHMLSTPKELQSFLFGTEEFDVLAVSAGFDRAVSDWGGMLSDQDYQQMGELLKRFSEERSHGRRFAVLEGGYSHRTLGPTILSFLQGFA